MSRSFDGISRRRSAATFYRNHTLRSNCQRWFHASVEAAAPRSAAAQGFIVLITANRDLACSPVEAARGRLAAQRYSRLGPHRTTVL
jgi:hypothetical protein